MTILKCKMCGGDLQINENQNYATCEYCGSTMTLPKASDERKVNLFNRANHFRRMNDFDKTLTIYENILNDDDTDAEAHWGVVLCRYGIEYVEDPLSHERIPTCHRAQYDSILNDVDYLAALENSPDGYSRSLYEAEAKRISEIQKDILAISKNEEPFDVFICYKESSESGTRTKDSAIAQDIYYQLTQADYKVFFSRITLEDKLGRAYEPYIFAALNSAKVMVVVGTSTDNFNAVWVKNEWSRFLVLTKKDRSKLIIPCYRDMDAYELPEELSYLQSQDMGKIGFIQDLIRGIKKVISIHKINPSVAHDSSDSGYVPSEKPLLERAFLCLEAGQFEKADALLEQVLNMNPRQAKAYVGKLMVELKVCLEPDITQSMKPLTGFNEFNIAVRFADSDYAKVLQDLDKRNLERIEQEKIDKIKRIEQEKIRKEQERINREKEVEEISALCEEKAKEQRQLSEKVHSVDKEIKWLDRDITTTKTIIEKEKRKISEFESVIKDTEYNVTVFNKSKSLEIIKKTNQAIETSRNAIGRMEADLIEKSEMLNNRIKSQNDMLVHVKELRNEITGLQAQYGLKTKKFELEDYYENLQTMKNAKEIYGFLYNLNISDDLFLEQLLPKLQELAASERIYGDMKASALNMIRQMCK